MAKSEVALGQAGLPNGFVGRFFGYIMSVFNRGDVRATIRAMNLRSGQRILEIGFGPGEALSQILKKNLQIKLFGIDHSSAMVEMATSRNIAAIESNTLTITIGEVEYLYFPTEHFDTVFSINSIYFWQNPERILLEIRNILKPKGRLITTVRNSTHGLNKHYNGESLRLLYEAAGFSEIKIISNKKRIICIGSK